MGEIVQFKNVSKIYKLGTTKISALRKVDFTINEGELVIILGASGAGKTTILNLLGGMDTPTSGEIVVENEEINDMTANQLTLYRRNKIGFVFQFYNLIFNLTAKENVEFASSFSDDKLLSTDVLKDVGLAHRLNNFPAQLSGGEQQRVAIARAIAKNPTILLCDEPTGALDYKTGKDVLRLLTNINNQTNKTIVIISHNVALAALGDKVIKVKSGEIESITLNPTRQSIDDIDW